MQQHIITIADTDVIDRSKVRQLVLNYKHHLAALKAVRGDIRQSTRDHINMVSTYMASLTEADRTLFGQLYGQEMESLGMVRKIKITQ